MSKVAPNERRRRGSRVLVAATVVALLVSLGAACERGGGRRDPCNDGDFEYIPGFDATGFSLGTNGRGYLSAIVRFGDCMGGYTEGRVFAVDVNARTAQAIPVDFWPGTVMARPDGEAAVVMAFRDHLGLAGNAPNGINWLSGSSASLVPLGGAVWDVQEIAGGWVVSAGAGGSWRIDWTGLSTQILAGTSYCGDESGSALVLCSSGGVALVDSNGSSVGTIALPDPASYVVATSGLALVFHGTSAAVVQSLSLTTDLGVGGSGAWRAWISPDAGHAFVNAYFSSYWLHLDSSVGQPLFRQLTDVSFSGTNALIAFDEVVMDELNLGTGEAEMINAYIGDVQQIEPIGPRTFIVVGAKGGETVEPGYEFERAFAIYDLDTGWGDTWSLVVE